MDSKLLLTAAWTGAGTTIYILVPATAPFFLPLALTFPLLWSAGDPYLKKRLLEPSALSALLALTAAYLLINASWSLEPSRAYVAVIVFVVMSLVLHVLIRTVPELPPKPLRAMARGFYVGYAACALVLTFELAFNHAIHLTVFRALPALTPQMPGLVSENGFIQGLPSAFLNRHIAALVFLLWPALLTAWILGATRRARVILLVCLLPVVSATYLSNHETSKLAIVGGAGAFLTAKLMPRTIKPLMVTAWLIACVAPLQLASLAYDLQLHRAEWLQPSARHRIVIWGVTSQRAAEAMLFGHGMASSREISKQQDEYPVYAPHTNFPLSVGPHAHNVYLQTWFDTGACGAVLLLMIGLLTLRAISRLAANAQPFFYAMYATVALIAVSSFSLWSRPFLASFGICVIFAVLAWSFGRVAETTEPSRTLDWS